jgi:hypothetical protein
MKSINSTEGLPAMYFVGTQLKISGQWFNVKNILKGE